MASITLDKLAHSYLPNPQTDADFALKELDYKWEDGGAYALLGPSGCGKTTLLNIISGLLVPSKGHILFDGQDVTHLQPEERNIAQVFQFPVIYDTMTVRQNLAFPLINRRRVPQDEITKRVNDMIEVLDLADKADRRARGLTADEKQKISLGRGWCATTSTRSCSTSR
jgi:glycerol transport system ATP-binding protein